MRTGTGDNGVYVTRGQRRRSPRRQGGRRPRRRSRRRHGGRAGCARRWRRPADGWRAGTSGPRRPRSEPGGATRAGLLLVLGIALLYTGISVVNTLLMATSDRVRDLAVLRLAGATDGQVLRLVAVESLTVAAAGALLGLVVAGLDLAGTGAALGLLSVPAAPVVPWAAVGAAAGACAVLAVVASVVPASRPCAAGRWRPPDSGGEDRRDRRKGLYDRSRTGPSGISPCQVGSTDKQAELT